MNSTSVPSIQNCSNDEIRELFSLEWWIAAGAALLCVIGAALAAGLTMGMSAQDLKQLRIKKNINPDDYEDPEQAQRVSKEQKWASKVEPLVRRHHLLLVSLLLMNAGVNEALPLFLSQIVPEWLAVVLSVSFVLFFGEIIPSAILTGPNSLCITAALSWFVWCIIIVLFPLSWPISKALDLCLGHEHGMRTTFDPIETRVRLDLEAADHLEHASNDHKKSKSAADVYIDTGAHDSLMDYHKIMRGAVRLATAVASDINTKHRTMEKIADISIDTRLDSNQLAKMLREGYSRYPVFEDRKDNVRGILLTKSLLMHNPEKVRTVRELRHLLLRPIVVGPDMKLPDVLNKFQSGLSHMALVTSTVEGVSLVHDCWENDRPIPPKVLTHIITMEDLIEIILKETILDETDNRLMHAITRVKKLVKKQRFMKKLQRTIILKKKSSSGFIDKPRNSNGSTIVTTPGNSSISRKGAVASTEGVILNRNHESELRESLLTNDYNESNEIERAFTQFDQDGDGKIGLSELRTAIVFLLPNSKFENEQEAMMSDRGECASDESIQELARQLMEEWDSDGDEMLNISEFSSSLKLLLSRNYNQSAAMDEELEELFKVIDVDQNGLITLLELHAVVTHTLVCRIHIYLIVMMQRVSRSLVQRSIICDLYVG